MHFKKRLIQQPKKTATYIKYLDNKIMFERYIKPFQNKSAASFSWYTSTNFIVHGITFLSLPLFTRLLSTDNFGKASLFNSWVAIITIFIGLNVDASVGRAKLDFPERFNQFCSSITFLSLSIFSVFFLFILILQHHFSYLIGFPKHIVALLAIAAFCSFIKNLFLTKKRFEYHYKKASALSILFSISSVILSIPLIFAFNNHDAYIGRVLGQHLIIIFFACCILLTLIKKRCLIKIEYWKYAICLSVPLILHNISSIINGQLDKIVINYYLGDSPTGIYSFAYSIGMIAKILKDSFFQAWTPWFYRHMSNKNHSQIIKRATDIKNIYSVIFISVALISPELVKIMSSKDYWSGIVLLPWIFLAYYFEFLASFEAYSHLYHKKTFIVSIISLTTAVLNIILNIVLIPSYGIIAAAISTALTFLVYAILIYLSQNVIQKKSVFRLSFYTEKFWIIGFSLFILIFFQDSFLIRLTTIFIITSIFGYNLKKSFYSQ